MQPKRMVAAGAFASLALVGGAIGATLFGSASAATTGTNTNTNTNTGTTGSATPGKWHSDTSAAHEASESPARAAEEKQADATGVPPAGFRGHSNTDPKHEASESPARAAQEKTEDANRQAG